MDVDLKDKVLKKFNINKEFWLGVGTIEPRKNYRLLIEAYAELKDEKRLLVIAGGKGWFESDLGGMVKEYGIKDYVKFLGYVSDEELSALYSSCFAFIYPSFYEGFGLPVLEAMSCGAAVITSNTSSLPEVGGDAVLYIDPRSKENLVEKMKLLMDNSLLIQELRIKSKEGSKIFSWDRAAETVLKIYQNTMQTKSWFIEEKT
jgi:glycosyltransferase involved in cell wall biosynthesis